MTVRSSGADAPGEIAQAFLQPRHPSLEKLFSRICEVSTLPATAQRLLDLVDRDTADNEQLRNVIQTDPAIVAQLLRRVNSAYYALRSPVSDVKQAISLLGFREVRNLALTTFVSRQFRGPGDHRGYSRERLWQHSVGVAAAARLVCVISGRGDPGDAYVAGLLHDLGYILMDQHMRKYFCGVVDRIDDATPTVGIEREMLKFDHAELGGYACARWNFPTRLADAVMFHHRPVEYHGPHGPLVSAVAIANSLVSRAGCTSLGIDNVEPPTLAACQSLGLDRRGISAVSDELAATLEKAYCLAAA